MRMAKAPHYRRKKVGHERRLIKRSTERMTSLVRDMCSGKRSTGETHDAFRKLVDDTANKIAKLRKENQR
jgi:hypothetical protein